MTSRTGGGYHYVTVRDHPYRNKNDQVALHRIAYEYFLSTFFNQKIYIPKNILVHHKNEIKTDNRFCNLEMVTKGEHNVIHKTIDMTGRFCFNCKSEKKSGSYKLKSASDITHYSWHYYIDENGTKHMDKFLCHECHYKKHTYRKSSINKNKKAKKLMKELTQ